MTVGNDQRATAAANEPIYFDDVVPGERLRAGPYEARRDELVAFAQSWDPLPLHTDEVAAIAAGFAGITASGIYVLAVKQRLIHRLPMMGSVIASLGYDEVRFLQPVRPGDRLFLELEWLDKRLSSSKPDRGVVKVGFTMIAADERAVMSYLDTLLMRRRPVAPGAR